MQLDTPQDEQSSLRIAQKHCYRGTTVSRRITNFLTRDLMLTNKGPIQPIQFEFQLEKWLQFWLEVLYTRKRPKLNTKLFFKLKLKLIFPVKFCHKTPNNKLQIPGLVDAVNSGAIFNSLSLANRSVRGGTITTRPPWTRPPQPTDTITT